MASRLGRGLGGLIAGGASTSSESQDKETIPVQFAPEVKEDSSAVEFSTPAPVSEMESSSATTGMFDISMDSIDPNPFQPRKVMDPETVRELANSIESEGLLQPIVVRLVKDRHQLIAGERRWRAHQLLNRDKITARIIEVDDGASASLALIENLQREDLNPIDEAMGFHSLVEDFDLTQAQVAERVGKSRVYVTNSIRLLQLSETLRKFLIEGRLTVGHAKVLLGISDEARREEIGTQAVSAGWTVRECEEAIDQFVDPKTNRISTRLSSKGVYSDLAKSFEQQLGRPVKIIGGRGEKGKITLGFENREDLDKIISSLQA